MPDLVIVPDAVLLGENVSLEHGRAGEAITAGQVVYQDDATNAWWLADNNDPAKPEAATPGGIALNGAAVDQPVTVAIGGSVTLGAAGLLQPGIGYYVGSTPGAICPRADVLTGQTVAFLGLAASDTTLNIDIQAPGVVAT